MEAIKWTCTSQSDSRKILMRSGDTKMVKVIVLGTRGVEMPRWWIVISLKNQRGWIDNLKILIFFFALICNSISNRVNREREAR
jgi:hypothetical protein